MKRFFLVLGIFSFSTQSAASPIYRLVLQTHPYTSMAFSTSFTLNATTDQAEWIVQVPEAIAITGLQVRYGTRTGTPPTYRISIQGVDANGLPDGTIKDGGGAGNSSVTFTPPADTTWNGTAQNFTLTESYTTTRGEWIAIVIDYSSGTVDGTNNSSFSMRLNSPGMQSVYVVENDAGSRTRQAGTPIYGLRTASLVYGHPVESIAITQYSSDSTPDERALRFTLDAGNCATFKVIGIRAYVRSPAASKTVLVTLYDGTTSLQTVTWDGDFTPAAAIDDRVMQIYFDETTLSTLTCGSAYRIGFAPQETAANFGLRTFAVDAAGDMAAYPGSTEYYLSTREGAGAWSDDTLSRPLVDLILDDVTEPSGSSGVKRVIGS